MFSGEHYGIITEHGNTDHLLAKPLELHDIRSQDSASVALDERVVLSNQEERICI